MFLKVKNILISLFVIVWIVIFHYQSTAAFFLEPYFKTRLPKMKFLFPPAGWIMFYQVQDRYTYAEVYGVKDNVPQLIDPHEIVKTRFIGFDMVQRNVLSTVLDKGAQKPFCESMEKRFPKFDKFIVTVVQYPNPSKDRFDRQQAILYNCL